MLHINACSAYAIWQPGEQTQMSQTNGLLYPLAVAWPRVILCYNKLDLCLLVYRVPYDTYGHVSILCFPQFLRFCT